MYSLLAGSLSTETLTLPIQGLPKSLRGLKLVQLSDFHFDGLRLSERLLEEAIAVSNQVEPDLVLLTGDYVTDDPAPIHDLASRLKALQSRVGTYAVLGNHDLCYHYPTGKTRITEALTEAGIQVLWNQVIYPLGSEIALVGLADFWSRQFNPASVMTQIEPELPRIVLSHNPDSAEVLQQWRVDLQLSGHTHGGQVVIPGLGPAGVRLQQLNRKIPQPFQRWMSLLIQECDEIVQHWEWSEGLHQVGTNLLYVNRGLGTYFPGRLFCQPEVTVITLV